MASKSGFFATLATLSLFVAGASAQTPLYLDIRYAHASIASVMAIFIFPLGGIVLRLGRFRGVFWVHVFLQLLGYAMFCYVFAAGIYMSWVNSYYIDPHIILGIILFGVATLQPFLGITHHVNFKKNQKRTFASYLHILFGRSIITLGILNGGLGLRLSTGFPIGQIANTAELKAYGIVAGIMWVLYQVVIAFGEVQAMKGKEIVTESEAKDKGIEARKLGYYEKS